MLCKGLADNPRGGGVIAQTSDLDLHQHRCNNVRGAGPIARRRFSLRAVFLTCRKIPRHTGTTDEFYTTTDVCPVGRRESKLEYTADSKHRTLVTWSLTAGAGDRAVNFIATDTAFL